MNLSKVLKQKRDAEDRLRNRSPMPVFLENAAGEQTFNQESNFATKKDLEDKSDINHNHDDNYSNIDHNHNDSYLNKSDYKIYELLTNGDSDYPELLFADGDILMVEV